jgi:hypothetical protein
MRKKRNRKQRTGRFCNISSFFMAPYFIIFFAAPQCAPRRELVSPSVTLAPHGEFAFHLSRSRRMASSLSSFHPIRKPGSFSSIFVLLLAWWRLCPFPRFSGFSLCDHLQKAGKDQKLIFVSSVVSIIVVSPCRVHVVVVFVVEVVVVSVSVAL